MPATAAFVIGNHHQKPNASSSVYPAGSDGSAIHTFKALPDADAMRLYANHDYAVMSYSSLLIDYLNAEGHASQPRDDTDAERHALQPRDDSEMSHDRTGNGRRRF